MVSIWVIDRSKSNPCLREKVTGDGDPGYGSTAKMLGEAALALVQTSGPGGFHTPTSAFGSELIDRLERHAGLTFEVVA